MFLVINAKARCDSLVWYSESTKIACDHFVCPLANSQFTILERYVTPKTFSIFELINASFALHNSLHVKSITSVSFSELELNKKLSKTKLNLYLLYFVNRWMTLLVFKEMLIGCK